MGNAPLRFLQLAQLLLIRPLGVRLGGLRRAALSVALPLKGYFRLPRLPPHSTGRLKPILEWFH